MNITLADGNTVTLEELEADVEAAKTKFYYRDFCFTYLTVDALLTKIRELEAKRGCDKPCIDQLVLRTLCRHCKRSVVKVNGRWVHEGDLLCWVDPTGGSQLHEV